MVSWEGQDVARMKAEVATKAARSAIVQRKRGSREDVRELYYQAHSLLRTLRQHLGAGVMAA